MLNKSNTQTCEVVWPSDILFFIFTEVYSHFRKVLRPHNGRSCRMNYLCCTRKNLIRCMVVSVSLPIYLSIDLYISFHKIPMSLFVCLLLIILIHLFFAERGSHSSQPHIAGLQDCLP